MCGAKCGNLIHRRNSIIIAVYTVVACISVPESCKGGESRIFLHCSKLSASNSNAHARRSFVLGHLSLSAVMEKRYSGVTQTSCIGSVIPVVNNRYQQILGLQHRQIKNQKYFMLVNHTKYDTTIYILSYLIVFPKKRTDV